MSEWKTIDSAPRDGSHFIGLCCGVPTECWFAYGFFRNWHGGDDPTHWIPFPPPPK